MRDVVLPLAPDVVLANVRSLCLECWSGRKETVTLADVAARLSQDVDVPRQAIAKLRQSEAFARLID